MPLYEYDCRGCGHRFETLVRTGDAPACPSCGGVELERVLSMFAVSSDGTRAANLAAGRKYYAKENRDKAIAIKEYEHHHSHDH